MVLLISETGTEGITVQPHTEPQIFLSVANVLGDMDRFRFFEFGVNFQIESIHLSIELPSIPVSDVPPIYPEDSEAIALRKTIAHELAANKIGLRFLIKKTTETEWRRLSQKNLLNYGQSYIEEALSFIGGYEDSKRLSRDSLLGVQLINVGNGILTNEDTLTLEASYTYSIEGFRKLDILGTPNNFGKDILGITTLIRLANADRAKLVIQNNGEKRIWVAFGEAGNCVPGKCLQLSPGGILHEAAENQSLILKSAVWGIADEGTSQVSGTEVSFRF